MTTPSGPPQPQRLPALPEDFERVLCVVAHPDDMEYGAAAAVAKWTSQGKSVSYLLATRGEAGIDGLAPADAGPLREQEERDGAAVVGVDTVEFLDHSDGIVEYGLALRRDIAAAIRRHRPDVVMGMNHHERFGGGFTNQADHRAVGLATIDAAKDAGNQWIFPELIEQGLTPWSGVRLVALAASPSATHFVDVSGHLQAAIESLRAHAAYLEGLGDAAPDPAEFLTWMAAGAGEPQGVEAAVLFEVFDL
ncbi:MAG: PIG-L deacetylase family protein [Actinomycetes bacterium]